MVKKQNSLAQISFKFSASKTQSPVSWQIERELVKLLGVRKSRTPLALSPLPTGTLYFFASENNEGSESSASLCRSDSDDSTMIDYFPGVVPPSCTIQHFPIVRSPKRETNKDEPSSSSEKFSACKVARLAEEGKKLMSFIPPPDIPMTISLQEFNEQVRAKAMEPTHCCLREGCHRHVTATPEFVIKRLRRVGSYQ
eukprot:g19011.t1